MYKRLKHNRNMYAKNILKLYFKKNNIKYLLKHTLRI